MSEQQEQRPGHVYLEGQVTAVVRDDGQYPSVTVVVKEQSGQYPATVAFRFSKKGIDKPRDTKVGDVVRCEGYAGSRPGKDGNRWFTDVRGTWLKTLSRSDGVRPGPDAGMPVDTGDDLPF